MNRLFEKQNIFFKKNYTRKPALPSLANPTKLVYFLFYRERNWSSFHCFGGEEGHGLNKGLPK